MAEMFVGAGTLGGLLLLVRLAEAREITLSRWQWGVTLLWAVYSAFVLLVVVEFVREGTPKGAVVMGSILGFGAVVGGVLLERFFFRGRRRNGPADVSGGGSHG